MAKIIITEEELSQIIKLHFYGKGLEVSNVRIQIVNNSYGNISYEDSYHKHVISAEGKVID